MAATPDIPRTMTVWAHDAYGGPERLSPWEIPVPRPGRGEVLVRVRATGLNAGDVRLLRGDPRLVRLFFGLRRPRKPVRGMDVAGTVHEVGEGVADLAVGDEVVGELPGGGGLAPLAVAPAERLVRRPAEVAPADAAALPIAGGTAWQALDLAEVAAGSRVLVIGASGGVGTFVVQLAARRGAEVWAVCGERHHSLVTALGAVRTVDRRDFSAGSPELPPASFDHVIDNVGTIPLPVLQGLLRPGGSAVLVAGGGGRILGALLRSRRSAGRLRPLLAVAKPAVLTALLESVARGELRPVIEHEFPFAEARAALAHVDAGHTVGKVVVRAAE